MKFHSPYQFIPIKACEHKTDYTDRSDLENENNRYVRHDRWDKEGLSGRISCRLKTVSPLVVGAKQDSGTLDKEGTVYPYTHKNNTPALPANSLRGMIASIVETISQSSLRVLSSEQNSTYTVRKEAKDPLKTIGVVYKKEDDFYLYPLPETRFSIETYGRHSEDATFVKNANTFQKNQAPQLTYATLLDDNNLHSLTNHSKDDPNNNIIAGVLYIRGKEFPKKRQETFIQWNGQIDETQGINVTQQVAELNNTLRRYQDKEKPNKALPQGYIRNWEDNKSEIVLCGDLLYYKKEKNTIAELSYSQIWRKPVKSNLYQALERIADKDTLPWHKNRNQLTPAECLFGIVEDDPANDKPARNLASRIQFTDAISAKKIDLLAPTILKILDSPKPPLPAMYFYSARGEHIRKDKLDLTQHHPNGRKAYLPHPTTEYQGHKIWKSKFTQNNPPKSDSGRVNWKQYLSCTPIPEQTEFHFFIHFENLSQAELGLLQTAIQPVTETGKFIHRLGLGKPLGLGQITLTINKIEQINRTERYSLKQLNQDRYQPRTEPANETLVDKKSLDILTTLYNPDNISAPICYPFNQADNQHLYNEGEGFSWFTKNEKLKSNDPTKQKLKPIKAGKKIPTLDAF